MAFMSCTVNWHLKIPRGGFEYDGNQIECDFICDWLNEPVTIHCNGGN